MAENSNCCKPTVIDYARIAGRTALELGRVVVRSPYGVGRRLPREKHFQKSLENAERIGVSVLTHLVENLHTDPSQEETYKKIFGQVDDQPPFTNLTYIGKGWNAQTFKFTTRAHPINEWVIKVGSLYTPDPHLNYDPTDPRHAVEMQKYLTALQDEAKNVGLPYFVAEDQFIFTAPRPKRNKHVEVTVSVAPFETILSNQQVKSLSRGEKNSLLLELAKITELRKRLIDPAQGGISADFDMLGSGNLVIVKLEDGYHIRLVDIGLRALDKEAAAAHALNDIYSLLNGFKLEMLLKGNKFFSREWWSNLGRSHIVRKAIGSLQTEWEIVRHAQLARRQARCTQLQNGEII